MDPNLFHLDWDRTAEVLIAVVIFSIVIERGLSILFESRWFINWRDAVILPPKVKDGVLDDPKRKRKVNPGLAAQRQRFPVKELVALIVSIAACAFWKFDAVSMIFLKSSVTWQGYVITGAIIAGGSKGSIKLFRDVMGFRSSAETERQALKKTGPCTSGGTAPEPTGGGTT